MIEIQTNQQNLAIQPNGITVVFGPTGIGKTTLLRQIAGHIPMNGDFSMNGETIESEQNKVKPQNRGFAYVSQSSSLVRQFNVARNLALADYAACKNTAEDIAEIYTICRIEHLLDRHASQLSGGESQQVSLAMALLSKPKLILLDEPLSALDMRLKYDILSQLKPWLSKRTIPVIYVSHDVNEVALIADYMAIMGPKRAIEIRSYQAWLTDVNCEFVTHSMAVNTLRAQFVRTEHELNLMSLTDAPEITFWAQGDIEHKQDYVIELAIKDISISLEPMTTSSILNQLKAQVVSISKPSNGFQFVSMKLNEQMITARVTSYSVEQLSLRPEKFCYLCFKTPRVVPVS